MTEQQKTSDIARITQKIAALKEQVNNANAETKIHVEKRDKFNEQFKKLRQEINELKNERDNLNEKVKTLKQQRDEVRAKIRAGIEEVKTHSQKIAELKKKTPKESRRELQKEFEDIEWKIQTTPLDMQEEKRLIEHVKQLETQLSVYKKFDQRVKKIVELRKELETFETKAGAVHQELIETAKKSQELHAKMMAKISESKNIKTEADNLHGVYIQAKEQVKPLHDEIRKLTEQKKKLQDAVREEDEKQKKSAEQALKEKLESQARDKLQRGEKLSWDEFKLLEDGKSEDV
ncbi:hypothetical protein JXA31_05905 [Candidatus Bathyarchaeota archaeon]|nr:hypothetical protein [Candidatus Bathyarchaeota archaeon]